MRTAETQIPVTPSPTPTQTPTPTPSPTPTQSPTQTPTPTPSPTPTQTPTPDCTPVFTADLLSARPMFKVTLDRIDLPSDLGVDVTAMAGFSAGSDACASSFTIGDDPTLPTSNDPLLSLSGSDASGTQYGPFDYDVSQLAWTKDGAALGGEFKSHFDLASFMPIPPSINLSDASIELAGASLNVDNTTVTLVSHEKALLEADFGWNMSLAADLNGNAAVSQAENGVAGGETEPTADADAAVIESDNASVALDDEIMALDPQADPTEVANDAAELFSDGEVALSDALSTTAEQAIIEAAATNDIDNGSLDTDPAELGGDAGESAIDTLEGTAAQDVSGGGLLTLIFDAGEAALL